MESFITKQTRKKRHIKRLYLYNKVKPLALYEYLVNKAKSDNVDSIELNVWAFNKLALNFYESLGMTVKNMKLENILSNNNVDIEKQELIITNKVLN